MKTKIFFISIIIALFISTALLARDVDRDTCEVHSLDNVAAYSKVEVPVRANTRGTYEAVKFDFTFKPLPNDYSLFCDSISWSDWFWDNPATLLYSGDGETEYIKWQNDTLKVQIRAAWLSGGLPSKNSILASIHLTIGQIDVNAPNSEDVWYATGTESIRWSSNSPWDANDSIEIDTMLYFDTGSPEDCIVFVSQGEDILGEFKAGYLRKASSGSVDSVKIEYSYDAGRTWNLIAASTPNDSEYVWSPIPNTPSDSCLIRITSKAENPISVTSAGFFTILAETTDVREEKRESVLPATFALHQNYPNPFNPSTKIEFSLFGRAQVVLDIYNIAGRRVKRLVNEELPAGYWSIIWNGEDDHGTEVASGVYFYRLKTPEYTQTKKMVIIR